MQISYYQGARDSGNEDRRIFSRITFDKNHLESENPGTPALSLSR